MDENARAAFIVSQSAAAMVEALGMMSENLQRVHRGDSIAYAELAFMEVISRNGIGWNQAMEYLRGY